MSSSVSVKPGWPPEKMEQHIARIRKRQLEGHRKAGLIDVEPAKPEIEEPEPEKK